MGQEPLAGLALELKAPRSTAFGVADCRGQATLRGQFVDDAFRIVVARVVENGTRWTQFCKHELSRRGAARLRDVNQASVSLNDT